MKILITGSSGLVGKNLSETLSEYFDLLLPTHSELDLINYGEVLNYLSINKPELIIHAAGKVGGIQANINEPVSFFIENLDMGKNIVLAARELGIKKLINLGSSCIYPKDYTNPLKEEYLLEGTLEPTNEGYALAKISVLKLCEYIRKENLEYDFKTIIPCNLYGAYDNFDPIKSHMIPAVIRKIDNAYTNNLDVVEIWGDGEARREFMHVDDLVNSLLFIINNYDNVPQVLNVGLGYDYSINDYYKAVAEIIGFKGNFRHDLSKPVGMKQKVVDIGRAKDIGLQAKISLQEGIKRTYKYYLDNIKENNS